MSRSPRILYIDLVDPLSYVAHRAAREQEAGTGLEFERVGVELRPFPAPLTDAEDPFWAPRWAAAHRAAPFDTVSLCFSKGLGAPVGSVLAGGREAIDRAHRLRKMLGGGMRQAGVLAAAALYALDHNVDRLVEDHRNARLLAERLAEIPGLAVDLAGVQTNILMVDVLDPLPAAAAFADRLRARGVLCLAIGPRRLRLVTHLDVSRDACERAVDLFRATARE
jgi:threonine aldolase